MDLPSAQAAARLAKVVELALADVELSLPQYRLLMFLSPGSSAASTLAGRLAVSRPSLTSLADGLVQRGFVERRTNAEDRRQVDHVLTDAGRDALQAGDQAVQDRLDLLLRHLGPGQRRRANEGLHLWLRALDAARAERLGTSA